MKKFAITLALGALAWIGATPAAEARPYHHRGDRHVSAHIYIGGHQPCGTPIYYERYVVRHDPYGYPVWGHRRCAAPPRHYHPPVVVRPPYPPPVVVRPCPPPAYHGHPYYGRPRSGVSVHFGHGGGYVHGHYRR